MLHKHILSDKKLLFPKHILLHKRQLSYFAEEALKALLFSIDLFEKKAEIFSRQCQARKDSNNDAQVHMLVQSSKSS